MISYLKIQIQITDRLTNQQIVLDNDACHINKCSITNNVFNPMACAAQFEITFKRITLVSDYINFLLAFNIVKIVEIDTKNNKTTVFVGYISLPMSDAKNIAHYRISCNGLLQHPASQVMSNYLEQTQQLYNGNQILVNSIAANKVPLANLLSFISSESILDYATKLKIIPTASIPNGVATPFLVLPYTDGFDINTQVYFYSPPTSLRLGCLLDTIYPYQRILYQGLDGIIYITIPDASSANFSEYSFNAQDAISDGDQWLKINPVVRTDITPNRIFASYNGLGYIVENNTKNGISYVVEPDSDLFSRSIALLKKGILISKHVPLSLSEGIMKDVFLIRQIELLAQANNTYKVINSSSADKQLSVAKNYAMRAMAQELFNETQITLTSSRGFIPRIPFGEIVQIQHALLVDTRAYYCYAFRVDYLENNNLIELQLCKPFTQVVAWKK